MEKGCGGDDKLINDIEGIITGIRKKAGNFTLNRIIPTLAGFCMTILIPKRDLVPGKAAGKAIDLKSP